MALRHIDGFDTLLTGDLAVQGRYTIASCTISTTIGRFVGGCLAVGSNGVARRTFDNQATWIVGYAIQFTALPGTIAQLLSFEDSGSVQVSLYFDSAGKLRVYRGSSSGTLLATTAVAFSIGVWYYLETKVTCHATAGTVDLWLNGVNIVSLTAQDTNTTANNFVNAINLQGGAGTNTYYVDDLYILDGTGTMNAPLGDVRVVALLPTAAGNYAQWDNTGGTANYDSANDPTPDGDATYVSTGVVNEIDSYALSDLPLATATVKGVQTLLVARKDETAARAIAPLLRIGGTDYAGTPVVQATGYAGQTQTYEVNPATGAAWTVAEVNGLEFGPKLTT